MTVRLIFWNIRSSTWKLPVILSLLIQKCGRISTFQDEYLPIYLPTTRWHCLHAMKKFLLKEYPDPDRAVQGKVHVQRSSTWRTFSEGTEMPPPFNIKGTRWCYLTIDNNTIYYTVCQNNKDNTYKNCDIYFSELINGSWTPIKSIGDKVNSPNTWKHNQHLIWCKTLYFVSDGQEGLADMTFINLLKMKMVNGWPYQSRANINSKGNEKSPFIHRMENFTSLQTDGWDWEDTTFFIPG